MSQRGWKVFASARKDEDLEALAKLRNVTSVALELKDPKSIEAAAEQVLSATDGKLYALFNNAGYGQPGAVEDVNPDDVRAQFEVNVFGGHDLITRIVPHMRRAGRGRIVQCSSVLGFVAAPYRGVYCASKFAMEGLTDALRIELRETGIEVVLIEPGPIRSRFVDRSLEVGKATLPLETSPHADRYRELMASLDAGGSETFKLEPDAVATKLIMAVTEPSPRARYYVTTPTYAAAAMKRALPTRVMDWIAARN